MCLATRYFRELLAPLTFEQFKNMFPPSAKEFTLHTSLTFVAEHYFQASRSLPHRPRLLIVGVDDISQACPDGLPLQHRSRIAAMVRVLGQIMDQDIVCGPSPVCALPVVISASTVAIDRTITASTRAIATIPLGALTGAALHVIRALGIATSNTLAVRAVAMLCQYVGEHGGLLEILIDVLRAREGFLLQKLQLLGPGALDTVCAFLESDERVQKYLVRRVALCIPSETLLTVCL
jgi:hypothetical protein